MYVCVSVALLLLVNTALAQPMARTNGQNTEAAPVPEHLIEKEFPPTVTGVEKRRKRSINLMQLAMRTFLSQAIEAIPTEGEDRLITNEICMNNTCLTLEMDLRELMEGEGAEGEVGENEEEEKEEN